LAIAIDRLFNLSIAIARENERERLIVEGNIKVDKTEQINAYKTLIEKSMQRIAYFSREYDLISLSVSEFWKYHFLFCLIWH
ncbi:hypothetical protein, partial [Mycoplasmopsis bovis]|uniref:hypothetical protein n=1 Tax=Mycoplasmopsis bovis TaxID=28903 RepID=UPI003D2BC199